MTPRRQAITFRIWSHAESVGWDITVRDLANAIGENLYTVRNIVVQKGWRDRLRATAKDDTGSMHFEFDEMEG
jgi:hypothetical protein